MQAVWVIFDDLAGKGVTISILAKYVFYVSIVIVPQAVPIAVLLASIMTLGNFSEKYEFAAAKSAGLSLQQLVAPLFIFVIGLSFVNLFFLNNAYPWAVLKQKNLYKNKVDIFKMLFDKKFNNLSDEQLINKEIERQVDRTIVNAIGTFHERILAGVTNFEKVDAGIDIKSKDDKIFIELKNKHNTVKGEDSKSIIIGRESK